MAQFLAKTVAPSGGDYTTLEACMNANEQDLTGDGWFDVTISGDWSGGADTSGVTIHNYTTTSSDYINIYTSSTARHKGVASTDYYILDPASGDGIRVSDDYVTINGLQITDWQSGQQGIYSDSGTYTTVRNCIIHTPGTGGYPGIYLAPANGLVYNCILYGGTGDDGVKLDASTSAMYNTTIYGFRDGVVLGSWATLRNVISVNNSSDDYSGAIGGSGEVDYCMDEDGTAQGANSVTTTQSVTELFVSSTNFHLSGESSDAYNDGEDLSGTIEDDIDGMYRGDEWSMGADGLYSTKVMSSGGDYTTLEAAVNAHEQDLTSKGWMNVCIDGTWASADSAVTLHNYTTSATEYVNIYTTSTCRHPGYYSDASPYYRIKLTAYGNRFQWVSCDDANLIGVQIENTYAAFSDNSCIDLSDNQANGIIDSCILVNNSTGGSEGIKAQYDGTVEVRNCVIVHSGTSGVPIQTYGSLRPVHNTICAITNASNGGDAFASHSNTRAIKNCYAHTAGSGNGYSANWTLTTCASSDGSQSTSTVAYSTSSGAYFTNVTSGSEDFHISSYLSSLNGAGTDLSATFTGDIDSQEDLGNDHMWRGEDWAIGVHELATAIVAPSSGDYTTLESCMNALEQDITAKGYMDIQIDGTWTNADSAAVIIHNYTTDADNYINIYTTSTCRHPGYYSNSADYYRLVVSRSGNPVFLLDNVDNVTVTGIQIENTYATPTTNSSAFRNLDGSITLNKSVFVGGRFTVRSDWTAGTVTTNINNCAIHGGTVGGVATTQTNVTNTIQNSVIIGGSSYGIYNYAGTVTSKNNYAYSTGTAYSGTITATTDYSNDGSNSSTTAAYSTSSGCYFTNVTSGSEDFHITNTSSSLYQAGTDLSATFTDDIDGDTRGATWDIGIDYIESGGASDSPSDSPSDSISDSISDSPSDSISDSISDSPSASPSPGTEVYSRGDYAALPANDDDLTTSYSAQDYLDVDTDNNIRVAQTSTGDYAIHQFKDYVGAGNSFTVTWNGQSDLAPSTSSVVLQIYNYGTSAWETLDTESSASANTDFNLTGGK